MEQAIADTSAKLHTTQFANQTYLTQANASPISKIDPLYDAHKKE